MVYKSKSWRRPRKQPLPDTCASLPKRTEIFEFSGMIFGQHRVIGRQAKGCWASDGAADRESAWPDAEVPVENRRYGSENNGFGGRVAQEEQWDGDHSIPD
ncbi:MAG: hypothetical protein KF708_08930 [Pirellulales bacterium]|nr:hypothetical protein [Pirellulales bacterium]